MNDIGKTLVILGVVLVVVGLVFWSGVGKGWIGKLPGDVNVQKGNFSFHFPLVTCLVVSLLLTFFMWLFRK